MARYTDAARLVDRTNLRAMLLALRKRLRHLGPVGKPDPALIECVDRPFESVGDASSRLAHLERRLRDRGDRRSVFLTIYVRMTHEVNEGIDRGQFANPDWMRRYLVSFANYYRRAFLAFERGALEVVPDPWRIAFGTAVRGDALFVQDSFLGVNAHINYDLALAVSDVGIDPNRAQKYADHRAVDDILAGLVDAQQDALAEIYAAGVADVDAAFGRIDEAFTLRSMTEGREQAWRIAVAMTDGGGPFVGSACRWLLRATATGSAYFVLGPRLDPAIADALCAIEADGVDVDSVLERVEERFDETA